MPQEEESGSLGETILHTVTFLGDLNNHQILTSAEFDALPDPFILYGFIDNVSDDIPIPRMTLSKTSLAGAGDGTGIRIFTGQGDISFVINKQANGSISAAVTEATSNIILTFAELAQAGAGGAALTLNDVLTAILAGTDIDIDRTVAGQITISYAAPTGGSHTRRAAISTDTTLSQAEYDAGTTSDTATITIPTWALGSRIVFLGVPEDEGDITDITQSGISEFNTWERVAGVSFGHKWWRKSNAVSVFNSGRTYMLVQ